MKRVALFMLISFWTKRVTLSRALDITIAHFTHNVFLTDAIKPSHVRANATGEEAQSMGRTLTQGNHQEA